MALLDTVNLFGWEAVTRLSSGGEKDGETIGTNAG